MIMLLCFGAAWPLSIYKSYTSKSVAGKIVFFLYVIMLGYVSGIINKLLYHYDWVVFLYVLNLLMVTTDLLLYYRNLKFSQNKSN